MVVVQRVTVTAPMSYMNNVCGLCGNWNGDRSDDEVTYESGMAFQLPADQQRV